MKEKTFRWVRKAVQHPLATVWLAIVSFAEASFFPLPPDMFLMPMVAAKREKWFVYSLITAIYSLAGGALGYVIGMLLFDTVALPIINFYDLYDHLYAVRELFQQHVFGTVFVSAFTPIPYKVFTISSGMFDVNLGIFLIAAFLGRWLRFLFEGWLMYRFGERIAKLVYKSFNTLSIIAVLVVVLLILFITRG